MESELKNVKNFAQQPKIATSDRFMQQTGFIYLIESIDYILLS